MSKKVLRAIMCLWVFFIVFTAHAQEDCPGAKVDVKVFFAGHPKGDSLTVKQILMAGKLVTSLSGLEIMSFEINNVICQTNQLTNEAAAMLRRTDRAQKYSLDHVHWRNKDGQRFCTTGKILYVSNPPDTMPTEAYISGYYGKGKLKVSEMLKAGNLATENGSVEIIGFDLQIHSTVIAGLSIFTNKGATFNQDVLQAIKSGVPGQSLLFDDIRVKDKHGNISPLLRFKIVVQAE